MKRLAQTIRLVLLALLLSQPAYASSGNELLPMCANLVKLMDSEQIGPHELIEATFCAAYLQGVVESNAVFDVFHDKRMFCPKEDGLDTRQVASIVTTYMSDHPGELHNNAMLLVHAALLDAFPCKE